MGIGIKYWEWEGMGLKKIFPLIYSSPMCPDSTDSFWIHLWMQKVYRKQIND